jgi:hypothetical protein
MRKVKNKSQVLLIFVFVVMFILNIFLAMQNFRLKNDLEQVKRAVTEEGYTFSTLKFKGLDGNDETVNLADGKKKTLLLVFNSDCTYCLQQYPFWKELVVTLDSKIWRVFAITSEDNFEKINTLLVEQKMDSIKVASISREEIRKARLVFTPMTIAVGSDGEVKKVWAGLWKGKSLDEF